MVRQLLQEQVNGQQALAGRIQGECQMLGGISSGGWIALSLFTGVLLGVIATLAFQWQRRRRQLRYLDKAPLTPDPRPVVQQRSCTAQELSQSAAMPNKYLPAAPQPKYYSPLTKSLVAAPGMLHMQMSQSDVRSSMRITDAGDTNTKCMHDQRSSATVGHVQIQTPALNPNNPFAIIGQTPSIAQQSAGFVSAAGAVGHLHQGLRSSQTMDQHRLAHTTAACALQQHQHITSNSSSPDPPTDFQLPASLIPKEESSLGLPMCSSPISTFPAPAQPQHSNTDSAVQQGASYAAQGGAVPVIASQQHWGSTRSGSVDAQTERSGDAGSSALKPEASAAESEIADEYEVDDLDDDWKTLLADVDARLIAQGARVMNARERSVAIKKMLVATGTRGVDFAMHATLQEVLKFRSMHGN